MTPTLARMVSAHERNYKKADQNGSPLPAALSLRTTAERPAARTFSVQRRHPRRKPIRRADAGIDRAADRYAAVIRAHGKGLRHPPQQPEMRGRSFYEGRGGKGEVRNRRTPVRIFSDHRQAGAGGGRRESEKGLGGAGLFRSRMLKQFIESGAPHDGAEEHSR